VAEEAEEDGRRSGRDTETKTRTHTKMWGKKSSPGDLATVWRRNRTFLWYLLEPLARRDIGPENLHSHVLEAFCEHFVSIL
jgi:hypothetical protein